VSLKYNKQTEDIKNNMLTLLENITQANRISLDAYLEKDLALFNNVQEMLKNIQEQANTIDNDIIKTFALYGPEANELRTLIAFLKMTNEIVSIGEGVKKYSRRMQEHSQSECNLEELNGTIIQLHKSTLNALVYTVECFKNLETCSVDDLYRKVMIEESKNDDFYSLLEKDIMGIIIREKELATEYVRILNTLRRLERSCDRSVNIANLMLFARNGGLLSQNN